MSEPQLEVPAEPHNERELVVENMRRALALEGGHRARAAVRIGVTTKTIYNRLHAWEEFRDELEQTRAQGRVRRASRRTFAW